MNAIVSITSHKGGVGKTTTTLNLGVSLAQAGYKVLLLDGDPQGCLSTSVGMKKKSEAGLYQVLHKKARQQDVIIKARHLPLSMVHLGIHSPQEVFNLSHGSETRRLKKLSRLTRSLTRDFDITLIDVANNIGPLNVVLLGCSDSVIIPVTCKNNSVRSLPLLLQLLARIRDRMNANSSILGLVLTMFDVNNPYEFEVLTTLREVFPKRAFFSTFIPMTRLIEKAETTESPVSFLTDAKELKETYDRLSFEILQRLEYKIKGEGNDRHSEKLF